MRNNEAWQAGVVVVAGLFLGLFVWAWRGLGANVEEISSKKTFGTGPMGQAK